VLPQFSRAVELWRLGYIELVREELADAQKTLWQARKKRRRLRGKEKSDSPAYQRLTRLSRLSRRKFIRMINRLYLAAGDHYHYYLNRVRYYPRLGQTIPKKKTYPRWRRTFPRPYLSLVGRTSKAYRLPTGLLYAVIRTESAYQAKARSPLGARGLIQIMPRTGRRIARQCGLSNYKTQYLYNLRLNLNMGSWYFSQMLHKFNGQLILGLAAYNAGPHNVSKWFGSLKYTGSDEFVEEIPFRETRRYVKKIINFYGIYQWLYHGRNAIYIPLKMDLTIGNNTDF